MDQSTIIQEEALDTIQDIIQDTIQDTAQDDSSLSSLEKKLLSLDIKKFTEYNLNGTKCICKVLRVYDVDTMTVGFKLSSKFYNKNIRWIGIDSPELHSKIPKESQLCRLGRNFIINNYLNKLVLVEFGASDKYGRALGTVYDRDTGENINQKLIDYKFARVYGANGTDLHKDVWTEEELDAGIKIAGGMGIEDSGK
jgi:endonuclease YncB( thermonuclease family)